MVIIPGIYHSKQLYYYMFHCCWNQEGPFEGTAAVQRELGEQGTNYEPLIQRPIGFFLHHPRFKVGEVDGFRKGRPGGAPLIFLVF